MLSELYSAAPPLRSAAPWTSFVLPPLPSSSCFFFVHVPVLGTLCALNFPFQLVIHEARVHPLVQPLRSAGFCLCSFSCRAPWRRCVAAAPAASATIIAASRAGELIHRGPSAHVPSASGHRFAGTLVIFFFAFSSHVAWPHPPVPPPRHRVQQVTLGRPSPTAVAGLSRVGMLPNLGRFTFLSVLVGRRPAGVLRFLCLFSGCFRPSVVPARTASPIWYGSVFSLPPGLRR